MLLQLFESIKKTQPEVIQKVFAVRGDITMEGLGISDEDEARLADEVNIIFHAAATINFQVGAQREGEGAGVSCRGLGEAGK